MPALPAPIEYAHISHDEKGVPFVTGTMIRFSRDAGKRVTGFEVGARGARHLGFTRTGS